MKAYVLVHTQAMDTTETVSMLRKVKGIVATDATFGPYDSVAQVEADSLDNIGRIVIREIRTLPGVADTLTCVAVNP